MQQVLDTLALLGWMALIAAAVIGVPFVVIGAVHTIRKKGRP
jgi:hypothetical protein